MRQTITLRKLQHRGYFFAGSRVVRAVGLVPKLDQI